MPRLTIRNLMTLVTLSALLLVFLMTVPSGLFFGSRCTGGRRLQCASNLRQLGLGVLGYANQYAEFPPGTIPNPDLSPDRRLGWGVCLLPFIDEATYYEDRGTDRRAGETRAWDDPVFCDLVPGHLGITKCPENMRPPSFAAIAGLGADAARLPKSDRRAGIFGDDRRVTFADIKDGAATTMMLAESDSVPGPWFAGGPATVRGLDPTRRPYLGQGRQFGGLHQGGANVLFADGSVKFLSESIDPKLFEALSTIAGGEAVSTELQ